MNIKALSEPISKSIIKTISLFLIAQIVIYVSVLSVCNISLFINIWFYPTIVIVHIGILIFLMIMRSSFIIDGKTEALRKINMANRLTLVRMSATPTLMFMFSFSKAYNLIPVLIVLTFFAFISDLLDGYISRKFHETTKMGRMLDSMSDYCILFFFSIALVMLDFLPLWFFSLILFRLFFQAIGQLITLISRKKVEASPTLLGKAAVAVTMLLYGFELLKTIWLSWPPLVYSILELGSGFIVFISIFDKGFWFFKQAKGKTIQTDEIHITQKRS